METTKTLMDGLLDEMSRVRELRQQYVDIGPPGAFGLAMIDIAIKAAEDSIREDDVVKMLIAFNSLQEITG